jgi:hypothetical protein
MRKPRHLSAGSVAAHRSAKARAEALTFVRLVERKVMSTGEVLDLLHVPDSNGEDTSLRGKANAFRKEVSKHFELLTRKVWKTFRVSRTRASTPPRERGVRKGG